MTPTQTVTLEVCKLLAQFSGALLIARIAVTWALKRYKSEKVWERRLSAYVDAVTAISEMRQVVGNWIDDLEMNEIRTSEWEKKQNERYHSSRRRLDEAIATALLVLPSDASDTLISLGKNLDSVDKSSGDYHRDLGLEYEILAKSLKHVVAHGRRDLGPEILI